MSVFNTLQAMIDFEGSSFLDMFAGSGIMGLEAMSRGFDKVVMIEKNKKVGFGNRYKETSYITWSGDKQSEGFEEFTIDIDKYVNNKNQNKHINNKMEIVLNVCWNANSQLMNDNVYAVIKYRGVNKKILLDKIGVSEKSCENRSLVLNIDMNSKNLTYELPKRYFAIKVAKKRFMTELEDAIPDVQLGYIDLTSSEFNELNNEWDSKTHKDYLIYNTI
jgi:hypothetical protein